MKYEIQDLSISGERTTYKIIHQDLDTSFRL
jgi:hypothetical protein